MPYRQYFSHLTVVVCLLYKCCVMKICSLYGDVTTAREEQQTLGLCLSPLTFKKGRIFIVPYLPLLWHGASFFAVLSEGPPQFNRIYEKQEILSTYSKLESQGTKIRWYGIRGFWLRCSEAVDNTHQEVRGLSTLLQTVDLHRQL